MCVCACLHVYICSILYVFIKASEDGNFWKRVKKKKLDPRFYQPAYNGSVFPHLKIFLKKKKKKKKESFITLIGNCFFGK